MADFATLALVSAGLGAAKEVVGAAQAGRRASAEAAAQTNAVAQQLQQQALAAQIEERRRQEQLRRERAQRLARFGAQGLAASDGSPEAVLGGLTAESARQGAESMRQRSLAMSGSLLDLADRNRLTLLRAAEAREKAALGVAGDAFGAWRDLSKRNSPLSRGGYDFGSAGRGPGGVRSGGGYFFGP
ncbi:MAG TPA: hypothetical protein VIF14_14305 [Alphaproteobacteria bacterium]